jgi:hypothetical protein
LKQQKSISYADDVLFYSNSPFEILSKLFLGLNLHEEKSGWVNYDGRWIKPLRFLGLEWDGVSWIGHTIKNKWGGGGLDSCIMEHD